MKRSWFPILTVVLLLGLLAVLATLQYRWLGQISDGERERLQKRLQIDTDRFAEDFNREIQNAYHNFQLNADSMQETDWNEFNRRFVFWQKSTNYPNLVQNIYFAKTAENSPLLQYNAEKHIFEETAQVPGIQKLLEQSTVEQKFPAVQEEIPALVVPVFESDKTIDRLLVRTGIRIPRPIENPNRFGILILKFDENVLKNQIFPDLVKKYFSDSEMGNYRLAVTKPENKKIIFQTESGNLATSDASAKLFGLPLENVDLIAGRRPLLRTAEKKQVGKVFIERNERIESFKNETLKENVSPEKQRKSSFRFKVSESEQPQITVYEQQNFDSSGAWTLNVQHSSGSLEQFITNARRKNLAVSFGILSLLAVSIVLIFVSAQRAKRFAQKQVDFVSAVSHEFRTPLAVIYSAGENLTDGVISSELQIEKYGNLIKREGKKLSQMVEQILEFAGARSGRKKYDLRQADVKSLIENALNECQPLIEEKDFTVEREIAENLPKITADSNALSQAIQNLIVNSIKYGNGNRWLKISAKNVDKKMQIIVEDKGIGISKKEIAQIFQPFYRAKSVVDAQIHGNGLGLSLVKQTVEAHNGQVSVESEIGKGSRFTVHLPFIN